MSIIAINFVEKSVDTLTFVSLFGRMISRTTTFIFLFLLAILTVTSKGWADEVAKTKVSKSHYRCILEFVNEPETTVSGPHVLDLKRCPTEDERSSTAKEPNKQISFGQSPEISVTSGLSELVVLWPTDIVCLRDHPERSFEVFDDFVSINFDACSND